MVTTVTTTVLTAMSASSLALSVILALIALLVSKELISSGHGIRAQQVSRTLNIAIAPLLIVFVMTVVIRIAEILRQAT